MGFLKKAVANRWGLMLVSAALGIVSALANSSRHDNVLSLSGRYALEALTVGVATFLLFLAADHALGRVRRADALDGVLDRLPRWRGWQVQLALSAAIAVMWLPYVIALFPGVMWYDTSNQLLQWFGLPNLLTDGALSDQHPVFDTMVFGLFVQAGGALGSADGGIFVYDLLQGVVTANAVAYVLRFIRSTGASRKAVLLLTLFFGLFPLFPLYATAMVKDSLFYPLLLVLSVQVLRIVRSRGEWLARPAPLLAFLAVVLLTALTKKTGVYIAVLTLVALIVVVRRRARVVVACALVGIVCVMMVLLPKAVFPAAGIVPGGKQEMLAIPFQQSALLMKRHGHDLPSEDRRAIVAMLGEDVADRYSTTVGDTVKGYTWNSGQEADLPAYAGAWARGLVRHPETYVAAFLGMEAGWLVWPNAADANLNEELMPVYAQGTNHAFFEGYETIGLRNADATTGKRIEDSVGWLERTPVGMAVCSRALWATWIPAFAAYECVRHRRSGGWRTFAALMPFWGSFLFLWVSPASATIEGMRYVMPMVFAAPLAVTAVRSVMRKVQ